MKNTLILKAGLRFFRIFFLSSAEDLMRLLPENCVDAYDAFKAVYDEMYAMAETEAFADGFSLVLRIGIECCSKETECERDGV